MSFQRRFPEGSTLVGLESPFFGNDFVTTRKLVDKIEILTLVSAAADSLRMTDASLPLVIVR